MRTFFTAMPSFLRRFAEKRRSHQRHLPVSRLRVALICTAGVISVEARYTRRRFYSRAARCRQYAGAATRMPCCAPLLATPTPERRRTQQQQRKPRQRHRYVEVMVPA